MSIPRFSNPHSITISIQSVTRSEFFRDENDTALWSCAEGSDHAEELAWLEEHLQGSLSSIENKPQKSKRHPGSSAEQGPEELAIEFRLVSSAPPQPISLEPKPPKTLRVIEREYEDNEAMAVLRCRRAEEVAVDTTWIRAQSKLTYPSWPSDEKRLRRVKALSHVPSGAHLLVLDQHKPNFFTAVEQGAMDVDKREISACPTIKIDPKGEDDRPQRHRRLRVPPKRKTSLRTQGRR